MAPMVDVVTDRYHVDYEGPHGRHSLTLRFPADTAIELEKDAAVLIIGALKAFAHTSVTFTGARTQAAGSAFSFPTTWTPIVGTSSTAWLADKYPSFVSWVGRSVDGRRVRITLQGTPVMPDVDYRVLASELVGVNSVLTQLRTTAPAIRTISGAIPIWADYANFGYNAYFQRKRRRVA